jgi:hypothetical protein
MPFLLQDDKAATQSEESLEMAGIFSIKESMIASIIG